MSRRTKSRSVVLAFFVAAVTGAGGMFIFKLFSFLRTIKRDELAGFAFDPILVYAFVAMGFLCMLAWAFLSGQFKNVEQPKYDMIADFDAREAADNAIRDARRSA